MPLAATFQSCSWNLNAIKTNVDNGTSLNKFESAIKQPAVGTVLTTNGEHCVSVFSDDARTRRTRS